MAHYDIFRDQLGIKYSAFGHALWDPNPGRLFPPVEIGDVGFIREGKFHRLFNALLPEGHPSHQRFGVPEHYEPLRPSVEDHINTGRLAPSDFYSRGVTVVSGDLDMYAREPLGPADASFACARDCGAVLSLPVPAQCGDTIARGDFGKWITRHIDSCFAFTRRLGLGVGQIEDIVLVTGRHRTRSWTNVAFNEGRTDAKVTFGVQVTDDVSVSINWQISRRNIQGAMLSQGPSGVDLPEDQCVFVRGFRVARRAFKLFTKLKGAAEHIEDPGGHDCEPELEAVSITSSPKYQDPLHVLLEYMAERAPYCDLFLVHDDDLDRLRGIGDETTLEPAAVMGRLQRSEPEIAQVACDSMSSENNIPRTRTPGSMVAVFSEELSSWGGPSCISQQQDSLPQDATGPSVPVTPPIRPEVQKSAPIPFATQVTTTLQPKFQRAPGDSGLSPSSLKKRTRIGLAMSKTRPQAYAATVSDPAWQISTLDDTAINAIQKSLAVLVQRSTKLPFIVPIAGLLLQALTMRDEVKQYQEECEIVMHKLVRIAKIVVYLGEKYNLGEENLPASLRAILDSLQRELGRTEQVLKKCSKKRGTQWLLPHNDTLTWIRQCDAELSDILQAFQAELLSDVRVALISTKQAVTADPDPVEARPIISQRKTDAQKSLLLLSSFSFSLFFFLFLYPFLGKQY